MRFTYFILGLVALSTPLLSQVDDQLKNSPSAAADTYSYDADLLSKEFHRNRRQALRDSLPENSMAIFFANPIRNKSADIDFEYHQDPNFYYLSGFREPNAALMIFKKEVRLNDSLTNEILFVEDRNLEKETWNGRRLGVERVYSQLGIETGLVNEQFADLPIDYATFDKIFYLDLPKDVIDDNKHRGDLFSLIRHFKKRTDSLNGRGKMDYKWLSGTMNGLREKKLEEELVLMRKAIEITCEAHNELMRIARPGMTEYEAEATIEYVFKLRGAEQVGFPSILGGGENSCILHYTSNRKTLDSNHLIVADIGAEYHGYTADVTRTIPVDGHFSETEAIIYNLVLSAQQAGIDACRKGNKFWDPHEAATKVIQKGLLNLGITKKYYESKKYFMHGTSHYLGLDVHDAGKYGSLQAGNVITVEPGIYIPEGSDCDPKWWNIGVRIEDDILITNDTPVNLSESSPRTIEGIEKMMKENSEFFILK